MHALALPARRRPAVAVVLLAHAVLLAWLLSLHPMPRDRTTPVADQKPLTVWLLRQPPPTTPLQRADQRPDPRRAPLPHAAATPAVAAPEAQAITVDPLPAATDPAPAPAPAPDPAPPLNLQLPRGPGAAWRWREEAGPPRPAARATPALEDRVAAALGGGDWIPERLDNDTVRLRQGSRCRVLRRPRGAQLDPMGAAGRASPWQVSGEEPC